MTKRFRPVLAVSLTVIAALLVFVALVLPDQSGRFKPGEFMAGAFLRIPLEGIVARPCCSCCRPGRGGWRRCCSAWDWARWPCSR